MKFHVKATGLTAPAWSKKSKPLPVLMPSPLR